MTALIDAASRYHVVAECNGTIRLLRFDRLRSFLEGAETRPSRRPDGYSTRRSASMATDDSISPSLAIIPDGWLRRRAWPERRCLLPVTSPARGHMVGLQEDRACRPTRSSPSRSPPGPSTSRSRATDTSLVLRNAPRDRVQKRYPISDKWVDGTSMRVGTDGRARIVYAGEKRDQYARFTGSGFATRRRSLVRIEFDSNPVLALDAGDKSHIAWTRNEPCDMWGLPGRHLVRIECQRLVEDPTDHESLRRHLHRGRAPRVDGSACWSAARPAVRYYRTASDGSWKGATLASTSWARSPVLSRRSRPQEPSLCAYIDGAGTLRVVTTK